MTDIKVLAQEYAERLLIKKEEIAEYSFSEELIDDLARKNHEAWMQAKIADGYTYDPVTDDERKTNNRLVDYDFLPVEVKEDNRRNANKTLEMVLKAGFEIRRMATREEISDLVDSMAETIHDDWAMTKVKQGYMFSEQRNDNPENGQLTHRDILPFKKLKDTYPNDAAYDINTAQGVVDALEAAGFAVCAPVR